MNGMHCSDYQTERTKSLFPAAVIDRHSTDIARQTETGAVKDTWNL